MNAVNAVNTATEGRNRTRTAVIAAVATVTVALAAGAGYWWYESSKPSQASAADCRMAKDIVEQAKEAAGKPAGEAEEWGRKTAAERRVKMADGYLGFRVAQYEAWAVEHAKDAPSGTAREIRSLRDKAQEHCSDAGVDLPMTAFGS
ncbi:hypothetical protein CUT44_16195 [Streptomyces carminius]|uniref:Uncharacterized protein n=1 Tax=Streptomyces carminius TaxID=2665496 RepID=A0A2M8LXA8_9ACTN|nr:hypothetical protein [Streptomyces carminius]PJE96592.1 hypothetical protein CUT44_16195 [Streptomyces carminius]